MDRGIEKALARFCRRRSDYWEIYCFHRSPVDRDLKGMWQSVSQSASLGFGTIAYLNTWQSRATEAAARVRLDRFWPMPPPFIAFSFVYRDDDHKESRRRNRLIFLVDSDGSVLAALGLKCFSSFLLAFPCDRILSLPSSRTVWMGERTSYVREANTFLHFSYQSGRS